MALRSPSRAVRGAVVGLAIAIVPSLAACAGDDSAAPPVTLPPTDPASTVAPVTVPNTSAVVTTVVPTTIAPTTTVDPALVARGFPIAPEIGTSYTPEAHANYRATDLFATSDCGTPLLSPVDGVVDEVLPNVYDEATDDPAARGGNALAILGDDGVRYYMAHFQTIDATLQPGVRVTVGQPVGEMGDTGRAGACHLHFGLSLPCPDGVDDWWIRRGVIWPDQYLDAWQAGENRSPLPELQAWFAEYPDACRSVDDTPYPVA